MEIISSLKIVLAFSILLLHSCTSQTEYSSNKKLFEEDSLVLDPLLLVDESQSDSTVNNIIEEQSGAIPVNYKYIYNAFFYKGQPYCLIGTVNQFGKKQFNTAKKGDTIYVTQPDQKIYYSVADEVKFDGEFYKPEIFTGKLVFDSLHYEDNYYIKLYFKSVKSVRTTQGLLTNKPLPKQTWRIIECNEKDKSHLSKYHANWERIDKIETEKGIFILAQYNKGIESEFDIHQTFFFQVKNDTLIKLCDFEDQWNWPYIDVDGDGVPEIIGNTDYKSPIIRKVYPKYEVIAKMESGI